MGFCPKGQTEVSTFLKYLLLLGTFLHWLAAATMISFGVWSYAEKNKYYYQEITTIYDIFLDLSIVLIIIGIIMFLITFAGFVGALRENTFLLKFFYMALLIIFLLEIIGVALVFIFKEQAEKWASSLFKKVYIERYHDDEESLVDFFQETFDCCGVNTYTDWNENEYFNCTDGNISPLRCTVPYSCCKVLDPFQSGLTNIFCGKGSLEENANLENIYTVGCLDAIKNKIEDNLPLFGGCVAAILVPQLLGIILGRLFVGQIESQLDINEALERRRNRRHM